MNKVKVSAPFDYQGQQYAPYIHIDLNLFIEQDNFSALLKQRIATENKIDAYSYQYEILEQALLIFEQAEGLIAQYIQNKQLNYHEFKAAYQEQKITEIISKIALKHLDIDDLEQQPKIKQALFEAYTAS